MITGILTASGITMVAVIMCLIFKEEYNSFDFMILYFVVWIMVHALQNEGKHD